MKTYLVLSDIPSFVFTDLTEYPEFKKDSVIFEPKDITEAVAVLLIKHNLIKEYNLWGVDS